MRGEIRLVETRPAPFEREKLLDEVRDGQHGRPHVEGKAVGAAHVSAPTRAVEFLDDRRVDAQTLEADAQRQASDPGADDERRSLSCAVHVYLYYRRSGR